MTDKDLMSWLGKAAKMGIGAAAEVLENDVFPVIEKGKKELDQNVIPKVSRTVSRAVMTTEKTAAKGAGQVRSVIRKAGRSVTGSLDLNGNGEVDIEDVIILGLRVPGVRIDRAVFLNNELGKHCSKDLVHHAIDANPGKAGISSETIERAAESVIRRESHSVSGISAALGMAGSAGFAADLAQYYGYTLRTAQELMYLYGFPEIVLDAKGNGIDSAAMNQLILCVGAMMGVDGSDAVLKAMAKAFETGISQQLISKALTKGIFTPVIRRIGKWYGSHKAKKIASAYFRTALPIAGSVIGGGFTYAAFRRSCDRLARTLKDTALSNRSHEETKAESEIYDSILEDDRSSDHEL